MKVIGHLDLDCFFISCERIKNSFLIGKPVIVGGNPNGRGVVSTASYEARKFGVHSAMPAGRAKKLCPHGIFLRPDFACYSEHSSKVEKFLREVVPIVERASIDEFYLDFTGCERIYPDWLSFGSFVKEFLKNYLKLPATIAISSNKLISKIAVGEAKPDGLSLIPVGSERDFLKNLPISKMPGIGKVTDRALKGLGFYTLGQVADAPLELLDQHLGAWGREFKERAQGIDDRVVHEGGDPKSISRETTFETDEGDIAYLLTLLSSFTEECCAELRSYFFKARTVTVKLRTPDFKTLERSRTIPSTDLDHEVFQTVRELVQTHLTPHMKLRLIGMGVSNFVREKDTKELFTEPDREKKENLSKQVDRIRSKYGFESIHLGSSLPLQS
jgi:DNA polymerase IV